MFLPFKKKKKETKKTLFNCDILNFAGLFGIAISIEIQCFPPESALIVGNRPYIKTQSM